MKGGEKMAKQIASKIVQEVNKQPQTLGGQMLASRPKYWKELKKCLGDTQTEL